MAKIIKSTVTNGETVTAIRSVKIDDSAKVPSEFRREFDYTGVTRSQLLSIATRTLVIDEQGEYRKAPANKRKSLLSLKVSVAEMLKKKPAADPKEKAKKAAKATMTYEELLAMAAEMKPTETK